MQNRALKLDV